jgi:hypothetical protein
MNAFAKSGARRRMSPFARISPAFSTRAPEPSGTARQTP